jgi:hypothetical protein
MIEDFEFNAETGLFDDVASESVLPVEENVYRLKKEKAAFIYNTNLKKVIDSASEK